MLEDSLNILPKPSISFECFPPNSNKQNFFNVLDKLKKYNPSYVSVTYGAGGNTRNKTIEIVKYIKEQTNLNPAAHLTCVNSTKEDIKNLIKQYHDMGVNHIVALRGDIPGIDGKYIPYKGGYPGTHDLIKDIKSLGDFKISVAGYPEKHPNAESFDDDLDYLKKKCDAGANEIITQYCFDTNKILEYKEKLKSKNINTPLKVGIMCISNFEQLKNFSNRCGASIPNWLESLFKDINPNNEISNSIATVIAYEQCSLLSQHGINNFHFYSLNKHVVATSVCELLGRKGTSE